MARTISNDEYDLIVNELLLDIKEQRLEAEQRIINNKSIADFMINHLLVDVDCINSHSSSCVSCPYRYECSYCDCVVDVVSVDNVCIVCES